MEHLQFTKVELPSQERRKRGGFPSTGERKNNVQHGGELHNQIKSNIDQNAKDIDDFHFDPHLVMKITLPWLLILMYEKPGWIIWERICRLI